MTWLSRFRRHGVALLALFVALGGTAYATTGFPANVIGTKQLQRNAVTTPKLKNNAVTGAKVADNSLSGADVLESSLAAVPSATRADRARTAPSATNAVNAVTATTVDSAATAANATNVRNAASATTATTASTATTAASAVNAANAIQLGGASESVFQRRVEGVCTNGVRQVADNGPVVCSSAIDSIELTLAAGNSSFFGAGPPGLPLSLEAHCKVRPEPDAMPTSWIAFRSVLAVATLSWFFSVGTTVFAGGDVLPGDAVRKTFGFKDARIEGQFIFAQGSDVATIKLHAFDGGASCELRGTVVYASSA
jgi:hypothetical protein